MDGWVDGWIDGPIDISLIGTKMYMHKLNIVVQLARLDSA